MIYFPNIWNRKSRKRNTLYGSRVAVSTALTYQNVMTHNCELIPLLALCLSMPYAVLMHRKSTAGASAIAVAE